MKINVLFFQITQRFRLCVCEHTHRKYNMFGGSGGQVERTGSDDMGPLTLEWLFHLHGSSSVKQRLIRAPKGCWEE